MLAEIFKAVLTMSAVGSVLAAVLLAIKPATERFFGEKWQFYIWLAVLFVMICPLKLENDIALIDPISQGVQAISVREISADALFGNVTENSVITQASAETEITVDWWHFCALAWICVAVVLFVSMLVRHISLRKTLYANSVFSGMLGRAQLCECSKVGAPLMMGCFKTVIYIPEGMLDDEKMKHIFAHESVHLRRCDILVKWFVSVIKCVHWFNPLMYVISRQLDEACEISCDFEATRGMDEKQKKEYMQVVLEASQHEINFRENLAAGLSAPGRCLKKRFAAICKSCKRGKLSFAVGFVTALCLTVCFGMLCGIIRGNVFHAEVKKLDLNALTVNREKGHKVNADEKRENVIASDESIPKDESVHINGTDVKTLPEEKADNVALDNVNASEPKTEQIRNEEVKTEIVLPQEVLSTDEKEEQSVSVAREVTVAESEDNAPSEEKASSGKTAVRKSRAYDYGKKADAQNTKSEAPKKSEKDIEGEKIKKPETDANEEKSIVSKSEPAITGEFNSEGGDTRTISGVTADENGNITLGIRSNTQETVDVYISDAESDKPIHSMGVPVPYEAAYVMEGLEPGKTYDIVLKGKMRNDWNIESEYVIY